ncbi:MAG: hypothetical protein EOP45_23430, partial [Sphingobacteriaceae bacterium]
DIGLSMKGQNADVSKGHLSLTKSFISQTIIKQLLTEGERFVMTIFNPISFADQGTYDMIHNLILASPVNSGPQIFRSATNDVVKSINPLCTCRPISTPAQIS